MQTDEGKARLNELKDNLYKYKQVREKVISMAVLNKEKEALVIFRGEGTKLAEDISNIIDNLLESKTNEGNKESLENSKSTETAISTMIIIIIGTIALAIILGLYISRIISNPIKN
ncbi:MCP four helix bundle domain-containing protein [Clostridium tetanomorphum]|uniref:MCP four helix bundle domain-containing protein n=1 Tax=Clostridium tetanomorphum TaxID=1553 RepID=UPI000D86418B|nr:MCP four helix bundle domain-containing protein [Clostridium tetanomorphum]SQC00972.1 methyl-accepting chemotaxis sensory transducer [Clostridium tetanomorphum]